MLKLTLKPGEYINIGENIRVIFSGGSANNIHLLIDAPKEVGIERSNANRPKSRFVERRREIVTRYNEAFKNVEGIICPVQAEACNNSWHLYVVQVPKRKEVYDKLREAGIFANVHYIPVYKHPYYQENGYADVCCPNAENLYAHMISLPLYPDLTVEEQEYVIEKCITAIY